MKIAFYGSSLVSAYWNGAATYYRGIIRALAARGQRVTFYEPDVYDRQANRDIDPPEWCRVVVFQPTAAAVSAVTDEAVSADVVVVTSGIGFADEAIRSQAYAKAAPHALRIFWDVDAPATLAELAADAAHPLRAQIDAVDLVLTYGGGDPVIYGYRGFGARECIPIYNAFDPQTHFPVPPEDDFAADLSFLGNRLPDREARVEEFFLRAAAVLPGRRFLLGGSGWEDKPMPPNVRRLGHVGTADHNALNASALAVLNISRDSMARSGFSPATRVFEAAGVGACLITDAWVGLDLFLAEGEEVLSARDGQDVADILGGLTSERAAAIGEAARRRVLAEHTYEQRAEQVDRILRERSRAGLRAAE